MSEEAGTAANGEADDSNAIAPLEQQRKLMDLLSQETRHELIQFILGHPANLPSETELQHMMGGKSAGTIRNGLQALQDEGIVEKYRFEPNEAKRDYPAYFYGLTEYGVEVLERFNYVKGVPLVRAVYDRTRKTERVERHESAPRPMLPRAVQEALALDGTSDEAP